METGDRATSARRRPRSMLARGTAVTVAAVTAAGLGGCGSQGDNPFDARPVYVVPDSAAAQAAASEDDAERASLLRRIARTPTAAWLTPEANPIGQVGTRVRSLATGAEEQGAELLIVVYGIEDRDCGGYSSGGLGGDAYLTWVDEIAEATKDAHVSAIVEPDALPQLGACSDASNRLRLIRRAVERLVDAGVVTYLDAGHSNWVPPATMAKRLRAAGIESARGFSVNVANFNTITAERRYADAVSRATGGSHYVIDTGRNGNGPAPDASVCNPPGRALGAAPGPVDHGRQDANLWIKPPGESDGACDGDAPAGDFSIDDAMALAEAAGW